ncbi:MAG TPA: hypothetical protein VGQ82_06295 [Chthoniobacterales bacterium]|nr:hypothetical protein [Chthoniobacterales bacterium]
MTKRALFAVVGLLSLCLPLFAQQTQRSEQFQSDGSTLNRSFLRLPSLTLADRQLFSFSSAFGWMDATTPDFLPAFSPLEPQRVAFPTMPGGRSSSNRVVDMRTDSSYAGGEMGFLYGRSTGKYGGDYSRGYVIGEVGNDKIHITVGASYEESNGRVPRFGR